MLYGLNKNILMYCLKSINIDMKNHKMLMFMEIVPFMMFLNYLHPNTILSRVKYNYLLHFVQ